MTKFLNRIVILFSFLLSPYLFKAQPYNYVNDSLYLIWDNPNNSNEQRLHSLWDLTWNIMYSKTDSAIYFSNLGLALSDSINDVNYKMEFLNALGTGFFIKNNTEKALDYYKSLGKLAEREKDTNLLSKYYNNLGLVFWKETKYRNALLNFKKCSNLDSILSLQNVIFTYSNIGLVYRDSAVKVIEIELQNKNFNNYKLKQHLNYLSSDDSMFLNYTNLLDNSLKYFSKCLNKPIKYYELGLDSLFFLEKMYLNISMTKFYKGNVKEALVDAKRAYKLSVEINDIDGQAELLHMLAECYFNLNDNKSSLYYIEKFDELNLKHNVQFSGLSEKKIGISTSNRNLVISYIYKSLGNFKKALLYHEKALLTVDSFSKMSAQEDLFEFEVQKKYALKKQADSINFDKKIQFEKLAQDNLKLDLKQKESSRNYILIILVVVVLALGFIVSRLNVINKQRKVITTVNDEMNESIRYAQRLQEGILVPEELQKEWLAESFIYFKPKDVVSGDFYWLEAVGNKVYIAAADCTGHGIPGAMVSMICSSVLNKSLYEDFVSEPSKILDNSRALVEERFVRSKDKIKDGMDISLCVLDKKTNIIKWAGANNPLWVIKKDSEKVDATKADKQAVGYVENPIRFTQHEIQLQKGDSVYLFSDGFQDQFGGEKGKKYMVGKMKKFILSIQEQNMDNQLVSLDNEFNRWKGNHEQVDDVCIIGFRIT